MVLAKVEGEARMLGTVSRGSGSALDLSIGSGRGSGDLSSGWGSFGTGDGDEDEELDLPKRRSPDPSEGLGVDFPLAASLSRRDSGAWGSGDGACEGVGEDDASGVPVGVGAFSPSFFFRAAAKAANLETFPPFSGAPPKRPKRG
jgi:hypothetical protein